MVTIYAKNNEVQYLFEDSSDSALVKVYNFTQMSYNPNALREAITVSFKALGVSEYIPKKNDYFSIILDFLGNNSTQYLEDVADHFREYLELAGLGSLNDKDSFKIIVPGLNLQVIASIVCNERFQEANRKIIQANSSTWRVLISNEVLET